MNINLFDYDSVNVQVLFTPNGNYRFINATVALFDMVECIGSFFTTYTYDCLAVCPSSSMYLNNVYAKMPNLIIILNIKIVLA